MTDRLMAAAETAQYGLWGWLLDGLEMELPQSPDQGTEIPVAVANLLVAVADMAPRHPGPECLYGAGRCKEGLVIDAALRLADLILDDHG